MSAQLAIPSLLRVKPQALDKLGRYLHSQNWSSIALLWGQGLQPLLGERVARSLAAAGVQRVFEQEVLSTAAERLFADSLTVPVQCEAILAIGGGKSLDAAKYMALLLQKPLGLVPTVLSNDGFCSPGASLTVGGQRRNLATRGPDLLVLDTEILRQAPRPLLFAGMGDLFAKATALWDWRYASRVGGAPYNDFAALITRNALDTFMHCQPKDPADLEFQRVLATSLMMCGLAMAAAGSSRPASGSEHLVSHAYDRLAQRPSLHGLQVGVASYAIAHWQRDSLPTVQRCALESGFIDFVRSQPLERVVFIDALELAPQIKPGFISLLSKPGVIAELQDFCRTDPVMQSLLA